MALIWKVELIMFFFLKKKLKKTLAKYFSNHFELFTPTGLTPYYGTELIILSHPIWIGDLRTKAKNRFVRIFRLLFAILVFFRLLSVRKKIFHAY